MSRQWLSQNPSDPTQPRVTAAPEGWVIYAVGDIHGRLDLLEQLLGHIDRDAEASGAGHGVVFLGDYVDRGPHSKGVIERLTRLKAERPGRVVTLKGNHEDMLLSFLRDPSGGSTWVTHGGRECLASYGIQAPKLRHDQAGWESTRQALVQAMPTHHVEFLNSLDLYFDGGDYLFVHAGVRPGVAVEEQVEKDLLWIRRPFLEVEQPIEKVVIHGHSANTAPKIAAGRIGIDTGAYATGVLTALRLQGPEREFLRTGVGSPQVLRAAG